MAYGYENARIIGFISILTFISTIILRHSSVDLDIFKLFRFQLWRIITSQLVFRESAQLIVGLILLYSFRQFERQMGSRKFASFVIFSFVVSLLITIACIVVASSVGMFILPTSGPFFIIYALLAFYYWHVPKLHPTQYMLFGMQLSEKSWIYMLSCQLLLSDGLSSILAGLSGIVAGYLYETDGYGFQNFRLPRSVEYIFEFLNSAFDILFPPAANVRRPLTADAQARYGASTANNNNSNRSIRATDSFQQPLLNNNMNVAAAYEEPSEDAVATLMSLGGFSREAVVQALHSTGNNVEAAANTLLR